MANLEGKVFGPYKLEAQLGRGGMATVYRAYQESVKRYVAVKVMSQELAEDPGFVKRFTSEAQLIASLQHPHILPVIDYGQTDGLPYLVMNYISGGSLDDLMRGKKLEYPEISRLFLQMASALDYAHKKGIIHRDFKPNNVLMDAEANTYLTDFGIARLSTGERMTMTGTIMGTPAYMSPEQGTGRTVDARSDLYSLGVVLYEMICGQLPFSGDTPASVIFKHAYEPLPPPQMLRADVSPNMIAVLSRAMAKDPDNRYPSGMELARAFEDALRNPGVAPIIANEDTMIKPPPAIPAPGPAAPPPPRPPPPDNGASSGIPANIPDETRTNPPLTTPRKGSRLPLIIGGLAVLALIFGIGGGGVYLNQQNQQATNDGLTRVAVLALSATKTPTLTLTPSATFTATDLPTLTPSATFTPSLTFTFTPSLTPTPNATETVFAQRMATLAQFEANSTLTAVAIVAATQTGEVRGTTTQAALIVQSTTRAQQTRSAAETQTAQPTVTPRPPTTTPLPPTATRIIPTATRVATRVSITSTPVQPTFSANLGTYVNSSPQQVLSQLKAGGYLTDTAGELVVDSFDYKLKPIDQKNLFSWYNLADSSITDFVASTVFTWTNQGSDGECGLMARYTKPTDKTYRFLAFTASVSEAYRMVSYRDTKDTVLRRAAVSNLNTSEGDTNHLLLVGRGTDFQFFINGKLAGRISNADFSAGDISVMGSTLSSTGIVCDFQNTWVYRLGSGSGSNPPTKVVNLFDSADPDQMIAALGKLNEIDPDTAKLGVQEKTNAIVADVSKTTVFYRKVAGSDTTTFRSFVISTEMKWGTPIADTTSCGIHFYGTRGPDNLIAFSMFTGTSFMVEAYLLGVWQSSPLSQGKNAAIKSKAGDVNHIVAIVNSGKAVIYVNGKKVTTVTGITLTRGNVGYYLGKGTEGGAETCSFSNTYVWALN